MSKRETVIILRDILDQIEKLERFIANTDYDGFVNDDMRYYASLRCLELIGEAVRQLPAEFKEKYSEIEWGKIVDLRNIIIHEYFAIESEIIWDIVKNKAPELKKFINGILNG